MGLRIIKKFCNASSLLRHSVSKLKTVAEVQLHPRGNDLYTAFSRSSASVNQWNHSPDCNYTHSPKCL